MDRNPITTVCVTYYQGFSGGDLLMGFPVSTKHLVDAVWVILTDAETIIVLLQCRRRQLRVESSPLLVDTIHEAVANTKTIAGRETTTAVDLQEPTSILGDDVFLSRHLGGCHVSESLTATSRVADGSSRNLYLNPGSRQAYPYKVRASPYSHRWH
ncbi:hypothetical protein PR048_028426 [Dryococelus australis]|uniref:Uncharacterized protein n=1 Tax=Dryococelus australis TaxID=614101 RepID=A0ABQ9GAL7_9NEOP|nr:hypothetical protein PR048_028426 [Dryococelus australis]